MRRRYLYRILCRRAPPALEADRVWHVPHRLDAAIMHAAAQHLVGRHDFTTFRAAECQAASPVRTLDRLDVSRTARRSASMRRRVRSCTIRSARWSARIAKAAAGRWTVADVAEALQARDRSRCGPLAPPSGLYLVGVEYPSDDGVQEAGDARVEEEPEGDDRGGDKA